MGYRAIYEIYSKPSILWRHDPLLGWSHEPGAEDRYIGPRPWPIEFEANVSINSLGLRGPEIPPPSPGELRVLFLGDSMVAGFEVEHEETFVALLSSILAERLERPVRTINAGVRGYGTDQSLLYLRDRGRELRPDLVVFFHSGNDPADNMTLHEMRRPFGKPGIRLGKDGDLEVVGTPVPTYPACSEWVLTDDFDPHRIDRLTGRALCRAQMILFDHSALLTLVTIAVPWDLSLLRSLYHLGNPHAEHMAAHGNRATDSPGRTLTLELVAAMARDARRAGAGFVMISLADHLERLRPEPLESLGIPIVPIQSILEHPQTEVRWKRDSHFNPHGHRLVAEELAPTLSAHLREHVSRTESAQ